MYRKLLCTFIVFISLFLASCAQKISANELPGVDIPLNKMNSAFVLIDPETGNSYRNGEMLFLGIENRSAYSIKFPQDYGVKIFVHRRKGWERVENVMQYPEGENVLPSASKDPLGFATTGIVPLIPDLKNEESIRVVMEGYSVTTEKTNVGAFIDIKIHP